jgi:hypothetical protein
MQTALESGDRGLIRSGTPMQGRDAPEYGSGRARKGAGLWGVVPAPTTICRHIGRNSG